MRNIDKVSIIKLIESYDEEVTEYEDLLRKRQNINDLFKYIKNEELLSSVLEIANSQYNTILMERQDINTLNDLTLEKERKLDAIAEIDTENNSEEFQTILKVLIENERKKQEKLEEEQRKLAEEERKRKLEIERKKQEDIKEVLSYVKDPKKFFLQPYKYQPTQIKKENFGEWSLEELKELESLYLVKN